MPASERIVLEYRSPGKDVGRRRSLGEELFKLAMLATLFIAYGFFGDPYKSADLVVYSGPLVDLFLYSGLMLWVVIATITWRRGRDPMAAGVSKSWRKALWLTAAISFLLLPNFFVVFPYRCPHGVCWSNRWIGVAWSQNGGPCGDAPHPWGTRPWNFYGNWYVYISRY